MSGGNLFLKRNVCVLFHDIQVDSRFTIWHYAMQDKFSEQKRGIQRIKTVFSL